MISIQNNLSVSTAFQYRSFQASGTAKGNKGVSTYSAQEKLLNFGLRIRTEARQNIGDQNALYNFNQLSNEEKSQLMYNGSPISELNSQEAADLIGEDGYFGVAKTSQRISNFVLTAVGDDLDMLKAGREGVLRGFAQAEKAWGGNLPDISYQTLANTLEIIDAKIQELGGSVVDVTS
ncbi:hypothetical protein [Desulfospira joergensenii]|uniref:hypothetical protein n=1 Tax=Desulfospira joergensenii TaxID=53329 RepID=UPI0003B41F67|nr:hypothetical protein [Desulfospira joergensenii]